MSTEVSTITQAEIDALARLAGVAPSSGGGDFLPVLKVNYSGEDDEGNQLPLGHFVVTGQDVDVYAKEVRIRPLAMHYQYMQYDSEANKMVNQTVMNTAWNQEFVDEKGTTRCGRPDSKTYRDMSEERKKMYSDISCQRQVRCLVSYEGKDTAGNKHTVENVPAMLQLRGANFSPYEDEVLKKLPKGRVAWDYWVNLKLERHKKGSITYYVIQFDPDVNNPVPLDRDTLDTITHFTELVAEDNSVIYQKYKVSLETKTGEASYKDIVGDDNLDTEFDQEYDEIPF